MLLRTIEAHPDVTYRHVISPSKNVYTHWMPLVSLLVLVLVFHAISIQISIQTGKERCRSSSKIA